MKDTRLGHQATAEANEQDHAAKAPERKGGEIRVLDDLELVLAGGGDQIVSWP
jgi:hypothetical protein